MTRPRARPEEERERRRPFGGCFGGCFGWTQEVASVASKAACIMYTDAVASTSFICWRLERERLAQSVIEYSGPPLSKVSILYWPVHLVWMTARLQQDTFLSWHLAPASEDF
jgi:hypothetical protein